MKFKMLACALLGASLCMQSVLAADQVINADLVVVGAGAGGTVAAASAAEGGLKPVLLEKNAVVGGNGIYMECSYAVGSSQAIIPSVPPLPIKRNRHAPPA